MRTAIRSIGAIVLAVTSWQAVESTEPTPSKSGPSMGIVPVAALRDAPPAAGDAVAWLGDYGEAMKQAEVGRKMLLVYFRADEPTKNQQRFEAEALTDRQIQAVLKKDYVAVRLPLDYEVSIGGERSLLLDHEAFSELGRRPGIAVIDYAHKAEDYHGYVVSLLPLADGKYYHFNPQHIQTMLDLPAGTLTQRTMIFAVRIHPERPASTLGRADRVLFDEARDHSRLQARIRRQGHHNWGQRFQRIAQLLGGGLLPKEVVAESWPGEGLVDAAVDCVDSWRQSSGHWGAVRASQVSYGYDIKKGENGIWYATGIFGDHRN